MKRPLWATPDRLDYLRQLQDRLAHGTCALGENPCPVQQKFGRLIVEKIGQPNSQNIMGWLMRAAMASPGITKQAHLQKGPWRKDKFISPRVVGGGMTPPVSKQFQVSTGNLMTVAELHHLPPWLSRELREHWKADDRNKRSFLQTLEKRHIHRLPTPKTCIREDHIAKQPSWKVIGMGVGAFTAQKMAKVFLPSREAVLWVNLSGVKRPTKNQKRKYFRYGEGTEPLSVQEQIDKQCAEAAKAYLAQPM